MPPICPFGTHPVWNGDGYVCGGNPPPPIAVPQRSAELAQRPVGLPAAAAARRARGRTPAMDQRQDDLRRVHLPGGPTPCPPGFLPSRQGGPACIPAPRAPAPGAPTFGAADHSGYAELPTPTADVPPKFTPLPTLTPAPTPLPTLTGPVIRTPLIRTPTPIPTLTSRCVADQDADSGSDAEVHAADRPYAGRDAEGAGDRPYAGADRHREADAHGAVRSPGSPTTRRRRIPIAAAPASQGVRDDHRGEPTGSPLRSSQNRRRFDDRRRLDEQATGSGNWRAARSRAESPLAGSGFRY